MRNSLLKTIAKLVITRPKTILILAFLLTFLSIGFTTLKLEMNTNQDDLVSGDLEYHKRYMDFLDEFGDLEYLYVVVELDDNLDEAKKFIKQVGEGLKKLPDIQEVTYQINNPALERSFLLYLPESQLNQLTSFLSKGPTSIQNIARWNSLNDILREMNNIIAQPQPEAAQEELRSGFTFLDQLITGLSSTLKTGKVYQPNLASAFLGTDEVFDEDGYIMTRNGKLLFCLIMPKKSYDTLSVIEEPLRKIRAIVDRAKQDYPNVKAGLTGRPVLQADEMSITNRDMTRATILAILAATILFILYFRRLTRPIMAMISLIFGISWTFGLTTLVIGYLNLLSTVFAVILVGAGIEFGLQIVSRYREELAEHKDPKLAVTTCITKTGRGNITAALTTAAAFIMAMFTGFKALSELGFIAGCGIILCLTSLLVVLPTMMYLRDRSKPTNSIRTRLLVDLTGIDHLYSKPKLLIAIILILTIAGLPGLFKLKFDHNLLNLQAEGLESVEYEKIIIEKSDESTWYAVSINKTPLESIKVGKELAQKGSVGKVETIEVIVPANQDQKIKTVKELKRAFEGANFVPIEKTINKRELLHNVRSLMTNLNRLTEMAFSSGHFEAVEELEKITNRLDYIYKNLQKADGEKLEKISEFQELFLEKFRGGIKLLESGLDPTNITQDDLPSTVRGRFISSRGNYATYAYPKFNIWDPEKMEVFVKDIRSVDHDIAGTPVEVYESGKLMQTSFQKAAFYALFIIIILVLIDFRSPRYAFLSLIPLVGGILWLFEIMGLTGIPFNLANFFAIPILLGVGVDNGVQIVHRYLQEGKDIKVMSKSTGAAVLLTSLTTGISFGMLILSQHRGIQSLGFIMALGAFTCLIGSMLLLPAILRLLPRD